jgi:methylmalonyl-CoA mutase
MADASLMNPFSAASEADWRAAVDRALKGADFDKALVGRTADGIAIAPLSLRRAGALPVAGAGAGRRWRIAARADHPDAGQASALALADLSGGADMLALIFHGSASARGFGLSTLDAGAVDAALDGVELDLIAIRIEPAPQARITARLFAEIVQRRKLVPADLDVDFGIDPIGLLARSGALLAPWADIGARLADMLSEFGGSGSGGLGFKGPFFACDARIVHEAGGSEAQELGYALACCAAYLRALNERGVDVEEAFAALSFTLAIDQDQLLGIAKLRALRLLAARMRRECGLKPLPVRIHAETAWRMLTKADAPVNMLRNAVASFSAAVGGADSLSVLPHSSALGLPDGFARRIARNMQAVLAEESHLWRVADPAAGAGSFEALTDGLCEAGWAEFQAIEREGGVVASLGNGALQARLAEKAEARARRIATGRDKLTGASAFPNLGEKPESALDVAPAPARASASGAVNALRLVPARLSEPFEALRARGEEAKARIFLANLGPPAGFAARAGFASGLFAAGGILAPIGEGWPEADGSTDLVALTEAFKASGASLACLCGTDEAYAGQAADAATALALSGARAVWLAGKPGAAEAELRAAGVTGFIFAGCDMIAALKEALDVATS